MDDIILYDRMVFLRKSVTGLVVRLRRSILSCKYSVAILIANSPINVMIISQTAS